MSNREEELKPCPFCGSAATEPQDGFSPLQSILYVWCSNEECGCSSIGRWERMFTIEEWNRRVATAPAEKSQAEPHPILPKGWRIWEPREGVISVEGPDGGAVVSDTGREIAGCVLYFFAKAILEAHQYDATTLESVKVPDPTTDYGRGYNKAVDDCKDALLAFPSEQEKP